MSHQRELRIGSIIHLQSVGPAGSAVDGGYLDVIPADPNGWVITHWHDTHIRRLAATHQRPDRRAKSGSWKVLSATGKQEGQPLLFGDRIYLLNLEPGVGYLDTFEWVRNLHPFHTYPMTIGVFTSSVAQRGGGLSGTWTIRATHGQQEGAAIAIGADIMLENGFPGAGFLYAYAPDGRGVPDHDDFQAYTAFQSFVFTSPDQQKDNGTRAWTITASADGAHEEPTADTRRVKSTLYLWERRDDGQVDAGVLTLEHASDVAISALALKGPVSAAAGDAPESMAAGKRLIGTATFNGDDAQAIQADWDEHLHGYRVRFMDGGEQTLGIWSLGGRVIEIRLSSTGRDDRHFQGALVSYPDAPRRAREITAWRASASPGYDFFAPELWTARDLGIDAALETVGRELIGALGAVSLVKSVDGPGPRTATEINDCLKNTASIGPQQASDSAVQPQRNRDRQLVNIARLWQEMHGFWQQLRDASEEHLMRFNRDGRMPALPRIREWTRMFTVDIEILERAIQQRTSGRLMGGLQTDTLALTDKLAWIALEPFRELIIDAGAQIVPVTFFSQTIHIRQLPYTDRFVFVCLPYDLATSFAQSPDQINGSVPFELMAIPHEVGHFIYRHAKLKTESHATGGSNATTTFAEISAALAPAAGPYARWREELFADLYGCVVAGPFAALGLLALLSAGDSTEAWRDDERHPTSILRPYFLTEMLRILRGLRPNLYNFAAVEESLDATWTATLERWGYVTEVLPHSPNRPRRIELPSRPDDHYEVFVNVDDAIGAVRPILEAYAEQLLPKGAQNPALARNLRQFFTANGATESAPRETLADLVAQLATFLTTTLPQEFAIELPLIDDDTAAAELDENIRAVLNRGTLSPNSMLSDEELLGEPALRWKDSGAHGSGPHYIMMPGQHSSGQRTAAGPGSSGRSRSRGRAR